MDERFTYLVQKHLDNNLTGAEIIEFDKYLENPECIEYLEKAKVIDKLIDEEMQNIISDPEIMEDLFAEKSEFDKQIDDDIARFGGENISDETRETVRKMHENMLAGRKRNRIIIYAAIAASVLTGLFFLWPSPPSSSPSPQLLKKQYYKTYQFLTSRSATDTISLFDEARYYYMIEKYSESADMCREILATETPDASTHFLYGLNLMEMDSMQSAIRKFQAATSFPLENEVPIFVAANWYESLCWLGLGNTDSAMVKLETIRGGDNLYVMSLNVEELEERIRGLKGKE